MASPPEPPLKKEGTRYSQIDLVRVADDRTRDAIMRQGTAPAFSDLIGSEFAGINTPRIADLLRIRKFVKGFYQGPPRTPPANGPEPFVQGYNIDVVQDGIERPHRLKPSEDAPRRYGFYRVHKVVAGARDSVYPNALLLDYGLGNNGFSVTRLLRDYLVQVYPDDPDLLLGRAYVALLGLRIHGGYFVLRRRNQHSFKGS